MEQQFKLTAPSVSLDFQVDENGWCKLFLHERGRAIVMGAEDRKVVIARLLRAFSEDDFPELKQQWVGMQYGYLLTLAVYFEDLFCRRSRAALV